MRTKVPCDRSAVRSLRAERIRGNRAVAPAAAGASGSGWKTTRTPVIGLSELRQLHRDVVRDEVAAAC